MKLFGYELSKQQSKPQSNDLSVHKFSNPTNWGSAELKEDMAHPLINKDSSSEYIPFGISNLYPQILVDMYHGSSFHSAMINFKTKAINGKGITINMPVKNLEDGIKKARLENLFNRNFIKRFIQEYLIHERINIKLNTKSAQINSFEITGSEKIRRNLDGSCFYFSDNWYKKTRIQKIPKYDKYDKQSECQLLEFQSLTPGVDVYAIPNYSSAGNWIWLDSSIAYFQKQNLENSINPSAIMKFPKDIANKEEKQKFIDDLQSKFTGAKNAGKVMAFFAANKELLPEIEISESNKLDKSFAAVQENIVRNVAYAHGVDPGLIGVATAGQLGNVQQLNVAYQIFNQVYLEGMQLDVEDYLNQLIKLIEPSASISINKSETYLVDNTNQK